MVVGDRYFIDDLETGFYEVTKEYYEAYRKFMKEQFEAAMPKIDGVIGKPIIFGTAGSLDKEDFQTLFFQPDKYKLK